MANYLAPVQPYLADLLMQMVEAASLATSCPLPIDMKPLELPKDEPQGNETTKGRKRKAAEIKEETEAKFKEAGEKAKEQVEQAKQELVNKVKNAAKENVQRLKDILMGIAELGIALGELIITCVAFPIRFALCAASIIGTCPIGPTVQPTQLVMTLKQFKEIGDDMGTKYSKCQAAWNKLGIDELISNAKNNPIIAMIPGFAATLTPITTAFGLVNTVLTTVKPFITMVGGGVCSVSGGISAALALGLPEPVMTLADDGWPGPFSIEGSDDEGQEVQMEAPSIESDTDPEACFNFDAKNSKGEILATNCKNFNAMQEDGEVSCDNCTKYKPFHKQITLRLRENTKVLYGSDDLFLDDATFTPLPGSLKERMTSVESKILEIENKIVLLESSMGAAGTISAGITKDSQSLWVDVNKQTSALNMNDLGLSPTSQTYDSRIKEVKRVDIYKVSSLPSYISSEGLSQDSFVGIDESESKIIFKGEEIPETDRIDGNTYVVFIFENSFGTEIKPLWINVSLLSVKYNFMTSMDATTKNYLSLDWEKVQEDHSIVVTANLKYNSEISSKVPGIDSMTSGINETMKGLSAANGQEKINNDNKN